MSKKVLLVCYDFPPLFSPGAIRVNSFAYYLSKFGHDVSVLTCSNPYSPMASKDPVQDDKQPFEVIRTRDLMDKRVFSVTTGEKQQALAGLKQTMKRILAKISPFVLVPDRDITWLPSALGKVVKLPRDFDVVIASYPYGTNLLVGAYAAKKLNAFFVADMRDLWTEGVKHTSFFNVARFLEKRILKKAALIVNISKYNSSIMIKSWPSKPVTTIYNGYEPSLIPKRIPDTPARKYQLTYAGRFYGGKRNPLPLLHALARLKRDGVVQPGNFVFNVLGNPEPFMKNAVTELQIQDMVAFHGLVAPKQVFKYLNESNLLLVITATDGISAGEMTTKMFEYIGVGRQILCLTKKEYEIATVLKSLDGASVIDVDNEDDIVNFLHKQVADWKARGYINVYFNNGDFFSRENQAKILSDALEKL